MPKAKLEVNDSAKQIGQRSEPGQPQSALSSLPLKALFHAEAQDFPQNIREIMSIELAKSSA